MINPAGAHMTPKPILTSISDYEKFKLMAERVGFEPTVPLIVHKLSKRVLRTLRHDTNTYLTT